MKKRILIVLTLVLLQAVGLKAQTTKDITVAHKTPFTEQLVFNDDDKNMQLTVKLLFDEDENTLTVTLTSPKRLLVFWADSRYKDVFGCRRWFKTNKLPYIVSSNTADRFRMSKGYRKTLPRCHRKYVFTKWIVVEGLQPIKNDIKLVNDSIVQVFTIQDNSAKTVTIHLRHVLVMDEVAHKGIGRQFEITHGKDFNQKYRIALQRDPCIGFDDDLAAAEGSLKALRESLAWFQKKYANGKVTDLISLNDFHELKQTLVTQFPKKTVTSPCPAVQQARDKYNAIVDSIQLINVTLDTMPTTDGSRDHTLIAKNILSSTRMLDNAVARWLASNDETERTDLLDECRSIISNTSAFINENRPQTAEEQHAVDLFRKAEQYFRKVCK